MAVQDYIKKMIDAAKNRTSREDLRLGDYVFVVAGLTHELRAKREKLGKALWIDVQVLESEKTGECEPSSAGAQFDFPLILSGQYADMAFADLKTVLVALTGCTPDEASQKYAELVDDVSDDGKHSNPSQPARGMVIGAGTYERETKSGKNAGKKRVYPRWQNLGAENNAPDKVAERRKALDAAK